eukprot:1726550-Amphidinium_carterae.1
MAKERAPEVFPCGPNPAVLELFAGSCVLTTYVAGAGLRTVVPMDDRFGKEYDLASPAVQQVVLSWIST